MLPLSPKSIYFSPGSTQQPRRLSTCQASADATEGAAPAEAEEKKAPRFLATSGGCPKLYYANM